MSGTTESGGICGWSKGKIHLCENSGTISALKDDCGGICGKNDGYITVCINKGVIGSLSSDDVGGIAGSANGVIAGCYNTGSVNGDWYVGGIVGFAGYRELKIMGCYNTGMISSNVRGHAILNDYQSETTPISWCYFKAGTSPEPGVAGKSILFASSGYASQAEVDNMNNSFAGVDRLFQNNLLLLHILVCTC